MAPKTRTLEFEYSRYGKQLLLSKDMKTKVAQHVPRITYVTHLNQHDKKSLLNLHMKTKTCSPCPKDHSHDSRESLESRDFDWCPVSDIFHDTS